MAGIHHLGFVGGSRGTTHEDPFTVAILCENFIMMSTAMLKLHCVPKKCDHISDDKLN